MGSHLDEGDDRPRQQSLKTRLLAASVALPEWARRFTTSELAALAVIRDECARSNSCTLILGEIAEHAGVGRTLARKAIAAANDLGVIEVLASAIRNRCIGQWQ